jgi:hypothetical protein
MSPSLLQTTGGKDEPYIVFPCWTMLFWYAIIFSVKYAIFWFAFIFLDKVSYSSFRGFFFWLAIIFPAKVTGIWPRGYVFSGLAKKTQGKQQNGDVLLNFLLLSISPISEKETDGMH